MLLWLQRMFRQLRRKLSWKLLHGKAGLIRAERVADITENRLIYCLKFSIIRL